MTATPHAGEISVLQTLNLLEFSFKTFADGIAEGKYAFWLGSGISRDRFPMLGDLIVRVLEYLRVRIDVADAACPYREALDVALGYAALNEEEQKQIDCTQPVAAWLPIEFIKTRLSDKYEDLLDIDVGDCNIDVLVWEGIDVVGTYADADIEPDAEHLCLAVLVKEGIVNELASANWDGLIEKAMDRISNDISPLSVCVRSEDLQDEPNNPKLIKFHGCALRARDDEAIYRPLIVGRGSQIANWGNDSAVKALASHLKMTVQERPALMLGLSAQDFNIKSLFAAAQDELAWTWPGQRPSYIFSGQQVTPGQRSLLKIIYPDDYENLKSEILKGSRIQAYAKPLLLALIFYVLSEKITRLAKTIVGAKDKAMADWIAEGVVTLRNVFALHDQPDRHALSENIIRSLTRLRQLAFVGEADCSNALYEPLTRRPASEIAPGVDTLSSGLPEASVAAAILGQGVSCNYWTVEASSEPDAQAPMAVIDSGGRETRLFVAATNAAEQNFFVRGRLKDEDDAVLIRAYPNYEKLPRAPIRAPGRTGALRTRSVSITELLDGAPSPNDVMDRFRTEAGL